MHVHNYAHSVTVGLAFKLMDSERGYLESLFLCFGAFHIYGFSLGGMG